MQRSTFSSWNRSDADQPFFLDRDYIRDRTRWIRDELDPQIARDGPEILCPDNVIILFTFLEDLRRSSLSLDILRYSRVHYALLEITGRATRWPGKLIDKVEHLIKLWEASFGHLRDIHRPLYEDGGRLHGISTAEDVERDKLLIKWLRAPNIHVSPAISRRHGDLGFTPGDWWINTMFAYRAGIIDNGNPSGGITCDSEGAYALLMTHHDETKSPGPNAFTYRARSGDFGRYRLTSADVLSRQPIRVLRHHTLRSFWTPLSGVRYEGLFSVTGWAITYDEKLRQHKYTISLTRVPGQVSMKEVLRRPLAEEADDYREYKHLRQEVKHARNPLQRARPLAKPAEAIESSLNARRDSKMQIHPQRSPRPQHHHHQSGHSHAHSHYSNQHLSPTKLRQMSQLYVETMVGITPSVSPASTSPPLPSSPVLSRRGSLTYAEGADELAAKIRDGLVLLKNLDPKATNDLGQLGMALARLSV